MTTALTLAALWLGSAALIGFLLWEAPFGWQDDDGYHDGKGGE